MEDGKAVMTGAKLALDFREMPELQVSEITLLDESVQTFTTKVSLHMSEAAVNTEHLLAIQEILSRHRGTTPLSLCIKLDNGDKVFVQAHRDLYVHISHELERELEHVLGEDSVYIECRHQPLLRKPERSRWKKKG
mgnify:CR=1 FL=1